MKLKAEERLMLDVTERIVEIMEDTEVSKAELARRLKVAQPRVTRLLAGDANLTLRTISRIANALGTRAIVLLPSETEAP